LEVLWKSFEKENPINSFGSIFEDGANDVGDSITNVSLVFETELENVSDVELDKVNGNKKAIPREHIRGKRKAAGDGVVFTEHHLENHPKVLFICYGTEHGTCTCEVLGAI